MEVTEALGLDPNRIRIIAPYLGGAFGGKDGVTVQSLLALAAMNADRKTGKDVVGERRILSVRHKKALHTYVLSFGRQIDRVLAFSGCTPVPGYRAVQPLGWCMLALALEHAGGLYRIPNAVLKGWAVYTNNPIGGAFRGFGVPQVTAGFIEQMMDMIATKLEMDPLELRLEETQ